MDDEQTPRHLAIIMGENEQCASSRGLSRLGQEAAVSALRAAVAAALERGVRYLTLFPRDGSRERSRAEINAELALIAEFARAERESLRDRNVRVSAIGELDDLPTLVRHAFEALQASTEGGTRMTLTFALSYDARRDVVEAARWLAARARAGLTLPEEIDDRFFRSHLATRDLPPIDLVIRTGGKSTVADFFVFEAADAEFLFLQTPWSEFDAKVIDRALERYSRGQRLTAAPIPETGRVRAFMPREAVR